MHLRDVLASFTPKSLPLNSFADPHPVNPYATILYKNIGGQGYPQPSPRSSLSPIFRTFFQVPYPVSPLLATLMRLLHPERFYGTKTAWVRNQQFPFCNSSRIPSARNAPTFKTFNVPTVFYLSPFFSHSCALFCTLQQLNSFVVWLLRTLCKKPPGAACPCRSSLSTAAAYELHDPGPIGAAQA